MTRFCRKRNKVITKQTLISFAGNSNLKDGIISSIFIQTSSNFAFSSLKILHLKIPRSQLLELPLGTRVALISWRKSFVRIEVNWQNASGNWIDWWFHQTLLIMQQMMIELSTLNIAAPSILAGAIDETCQNERHWSVNYQSCFLRKTIIMSSTLVVGSKSSKIAECIGNA